MANSGCKCKKENAKREKGDSGRNDHGRNGNGRNGNGRNGHKKNGQNSEEDENLKLVNNIFLFASILGIMSVVDISMLCYKADVNMTVVSEAIFFNAIILIAVMALDYHDTGTPKLLAKISILYVLSFMSTITDIESSQEIHIPDMPASIQEYEGPIKFFSKVLFIKSARTLMNEYVPEEEH